MRVGTVGYLPLLFHQPEHLVQIRQALLDLAVQNAQKTQWNVELNHEGIHHHQVAQRHVPVHHALSRAIEHDDQRNRNDELLSGIEQTQRGLALDRRTAVALQVFIVTFGFEFFVVEVLDRFVVEQ